MVTTSGNTILPTLAGSKVIWDRAFEGPIWSVKRLQILGRRQTGLGLHPFEPDQTQSGLYNHLNRPTTMTATSEMTMAMMSILIRLQARLAQLVKAWIAGSSPTAGGVFFWYGPLASFSLKIASVGSDHHTKKMEGPTCGLGSKSLRGCKRSISPFSLRAVEFRRVKCKQMA